MSCQECCLGEIDRDGYRRLIVNKQRIRAHRYVWMLFFGSIPPGMLVLHKCDNPACINPEHLFLGTVEDNNNDRQAKGRTLFGERHGQAKISEAQAREVISALQADGSAKRVCAQLGLSRHIVSDIKRGKTWKRLPR